MGLKDVIISLQDNPYFGAGAGLFGVGALAAVSRKGFQYANIVFRRHFVMSLEVTSKDKSYDWVLAWITHHASTTQHLSVETTFKQMETGTIHTQYGFVPSVGDHYIKYQGKWIRVERHRETRMAAGDGGGKMAGPWESVTLTAFGRKKIIFFDILEAARDRALKNEQGKTLVYTPKAGDWRVYGHPRKKRPLDSVILNDDTAKRIVHDVQDFINSPQWYFDRGIPYRRGYLLHGPPGCGKSSFITALAGELDYSISVLSLGDFGMSDVVLLNLLAVTPQQSIILLEDIDAVFQGRDPGADNSAKFEGMGRLTFSGLLNALDGVLSSEARILFMTTNHIERLDPALIRPGRVDVIEEIGHCTSIQLERMFSRFYPQAPASLASQFAHLLISTGQPVSPAMVQGHFMYSKDNPEEALANVQRRMLGVEKIGGNKPST